MGGNESRSIVAAFALASESRRGWEFALENRETPARFTVALPRWVSPLKRVEIGACNHGPRRIETGLLADWP